MWKYIGKIFADQDGQPSFTRYGCGVLILVWCVLALWKMEIPDKTPEFSAMLLALYGANSIRNAVQAFSKNNQDPQQ